MLRLHNEICCQGFNDGSDCADGRDLFADRCGVVNQCGWRLDVNATKRVADGFSFCLTTCRFPSPRLLLVSFVSVQVGTGPKHRQNAPLGCVPFLKCNLSPILAGQVLSRLGRDELLPSGSMDRVISSIYIQRVATLCVLL